MTENYASIGVPDLHGNGLAIGRHVLVQVRRNDLQEVGQSIYTYISLDMILHISSERLYFSILNHVCLNVSIAF